VSDFSFEDLFGSRSDWTLTSIPGLPDQVELIIKFRDFKKETGGENLAYELGSQNPHNMTATQLLYGILLLLMKNQADSINADPEQMAYINEADKTLATGAREGQIKRSFIVSFFTIVKPSGFPGVDGIDDIANFYPTEAA
jgi:hypothetical protein